MRFEVHVDQAELADDAAALVTEERVGDAVRRGERREARDGVIADRVQGVPGVSQCGKDALQLDQLRLAIRSPSRAPVEDDQGLA